MQVHYNSASPLGDAFTTKSGRSLRRWLLASGRDALNVLSPSGWTPDVKGGLVEVGAIRTDNGFASGFVRLENR